MNRSDGDFELGEVVPTELAMAETADLETPANENPTSTATWASAIASTPDDARARPGVASYSLDEQVPPPREPPGAHERAVVFPATLLGIPASAKVPTKGPTKGPTTNPPEGAALVVHTVQRGERAMTGLSGAAANAEALAAEHDFGGHLPWYDQAVYAAQEEVFEEPARTRTGRAVLGLVLGLGLAAGAFAILRLGGFDALDKGSEKSAPKEPALIDSATAARSALAPTVPPEAASAAARPAVPPSPSTPTPAAPSATTPGAAAEVRSPATSPARASGLKGPDARLGRTIAAVSSRDASRRRNDGATAPRSVSSSARTPSADSAGGAGAKSASVLHEPRPASTPGSTALSNASSTAPSPSTASSTMSSAPGSSQRTAASNPTAPPAPSAGFGVPEPSPAKPTPEKPHVTRADDPDSTLPLEVE